MTDSALFRNRRNPTGRLAVDSEMRFVFQRNARKFSIFRQSSPEGSFRKKVPVWSDLDGILEAPSS